MSASLKLQSVRTENGDQVMRPCAMAPLAPFAAVPADLQVAARDGFLPPCKSDTLDVLESNLQVQGFTGTK